MAAAGGIAPIAGWRNKLRAALTQMSGRYRALGAYPAARHLITAAGISYIGSDFNGIALVALSFHLGGGALAVGGMLVFSSLPRLLAQGPAGAIVDRHAGPQLLIATQLLLAVIAAGYVLLTINPSLWLLYGLVMAAGLVRTIDTPAFEVQLMVLVPPPQRGAANALHVLMSSTSGLVGPVLGGVILGLFGVVPLFILNSLSFLAVVAVLITLRSAGSESLAKAATAANTSPGSSIGYLALLRRPDVVLYTAVSAASAAIAVAALALAIVRSQELGLGEGGVGLFFAISAAGALLGGLMAGGGTYEGRRAFVIAAAACGAGFVCFVLFGVATSVLVTLIALALAGLLSPIEEIAGLTAFQNLLPEGVYGRTFSLFLIAGSAGSLIGGLLGPALYESVGLGATLLALAVPGIILSIVFGLWAAQSNRLSLPVPLLPEPEVSGHLLVGAPLPSPELIPSVADGGNLLAPRLYRYI